MIQYPELQGRRVLVAEDEFVIGLTLCDALEAQGCEVLGPFGQLSEALSAAQRESLDAAILDVNLRGELAYPIADLLETMEVPFVLTTGYELKGSPEQTKSRPVCSKPYAMETLMGMIVRMLKDDAVA